MLIKILVLHSEGLSQVKIAKIMKCSCCAVQTIIKRQNKTQFKTRCGRGRKRKTSAREDRLLKQNTLKDRR